MRSISGLPAKRVLSIVDSYLKSVEQHPDLSFSIPPAPIGAAELYVKYKVRLDQAPRLVEQGLQQVEKQGKYRLEADTFPSKLEKRKKAILSPTSALPR